MSKLGVIVLGIVGGFVLAHFVNRTEKGSRALNQADAAMCRTVRRAADAVGGAAGKVKSSERVNQVLSTASSAVEKISGGKISGAAKGSGSKSSSAKTGK